MMYTNEEFLYALLVFAYNGVEMVAGLYGYKGSLTTSTLGFNVFSLTLVATAGFEPTTLGL